VPQEWHRLPQVRLARGLSVPLVQAHSGQEPDAGE
jgi:hypothetical protein